MELGKRIGRGNTAEVFEWGGGQILKLYYRSTAHLAEQEYRIAQHLEEAGVAAPKVYEQVEYEGRTGIVFERIQGSTMMKRMVSNLWKIKREARTMAQLHFACHQCVASFLPTQAERYLELIQHGQGLSQERKDHLLMKLASMEMGDRLCHGDFHPDNVLYAEHGPVVIDWLTATCGNSLADVARTNLMLKYAALPEKMPTVVKAVLQMARNAMYQAYVQEYMRLANVTLLDIEQWEAIVAAARLVEPIPTSEKKRLIALIEENSR